MRYVEFNPSTGEILQTGFGPDGAEPEAAIVLEEDAPAIVSRMTHRVVAGAIVAYDESQRAAKAQVPKHAAAWDNATMAWVDLRAEAQLRPDKLSEMKAARDARLNGGFAWDGSTFDSNDTAQLRLLGLKDAAQEPGYEPEVWRLADNSWRELSAADALAVWAALKAHIRYCFTTFAALEAQIAAANTEELEGISWPT